MEDSKTVAPRRPTRPEEARVIRAVRNQAEMVVQDLDSHLAEDHPARGVWAFVERMDLDGLYGDIKAVEGQAGRPATDPRVLLALWLYATAEGVGSARYLAQLCEEQDGFRWLRGGVPVNYHLLSDFRVQHGEELDRLLTELLAAMMAAKVVTLKRVSQDGLRVRASAGAGSFRREAKLKELLAQAQEQVQRLAQEREQPDGGTSRRVQAGRRRAAEERQQRVALALEQLPKVRAAKKDTEGRERARVSTTDAEARVMKMADGGFRPAYNVQLATDTATQVVVGVAVTNGGSDGGQATPVLQQVVQRCRHKPSEYLMDSGFATLEEVRAITKEEVTLYAPVQRPRSAKREGTTPLPNDPLEVAAWRRRMATEEAKAIYKERAATSECVNAQYRQRYGARQFTVRGLTKVSAVATLMALTHNMLRWLALM
jgi:transposase